MPAPATWIGPRPVEQVPVAPLVQLGSSSEKYVCWTPEPPALSAAASVTSTAVLFQPFAFGAGDASTVVVGGVTSQPSVSTRSSTGGGIFRTAVSTSLQPSLCAVTL